MAARYWCHLCSQMVIPIMEIEIKCPYCESGFVEEISSRSRDSQDPDTDFSSDRALSLWAPILLGMMGNSRRRRRFRRTEFEDDDDDNDDGGVSELDRELESFVRRRRRNSATILQLLQGIRAGIVSESENLNSEGDRDREREGVILINPLNRTIIVQGSYDSSNGPNQNHTPVGSLGDYFVGPGLDLLLQHLAENDPNRYGTPPALKEAIEALPNVTIKETIQCSVCLDDLEVGTEAKEMPCKHKFHSNCLLPWLELHSSCPVCRFQLPADESKSDSERSQNISDRRVSDDNDGDNNNNNNTSSSSSSSSNDNNNNDNGSITEEGEGDGRNGNGRRFSFPWLFSSLFSSSSGSHSSGSNSTPTTSSSLPNASRTDED
ncbi:hypothetical protein JCGZ_16194 [Jatropha curcas]|uniref:RING-type E3 ubiquitin transferase n=2 Tax=Jatropha curcas TaxID=180498 RepID=A0A067KFL5_JATCU|nr:hypothetical protein JCGZ_16194 [Jatropha curcas]